MQYNFRGIKVSFNLLLTEEEGQNRHCSSIKSNRPRICKRMQYSKLESRSCDHEIQLQRKLRYVSEGLLYFFLTGQQLMLGCLIYDSKVCEIFYLFKLLYCKFAFTFINLQLDICMVTISGTFIYFVLCQVTK